MCEYESANASEVEMGLQYQLDAQADMQAEEERYRAAGYEIHTRHSAGGVKHGGDTSMVTPVMAPKMSSIPPVHLSRGLREAVAALVDTQQRAEALRTIIRTLIAKCSTGTCQDLAQVFIREIEANENEL
jgi:hypothetical protein